VQETSFAVAPKVKQVKTDLQVVEFSFVVSLSGGGRGRPTVTAAIPPPGVASEWRWSPPGFRHA
jgi:hypothetical protein